jgi:hypothetical protein
MKLIIIPFSIGLLLAACGPDKNSEADTNQSATHESPQEARTAEPAPYFRIISSTETFRKQFNSFAQKHQMGRIRSIRINDGDVCNSFTCTVRDRIEIIGQLNKNDNSVRSITMFASGNGTAESGAEIMMMMYALMAAADPSLSDQDKTEILRSLGIFDAHEDANELSGSTVRNGIKYYISASGLLGIFFGAQSAEDR